MATNAVLMGMLIIVTVIDVCFYYKLMNRVRTLEDYFKPLMDISKTKP